MLDPAVVPVLVVLPELLVLPGMATVSLVVFVPVMMPVLVPVARVVQKQWKYQC